MTRTLTELYCCRLLHTPFNHTRSSFPTTSGLFHCEEWRWCLGSGWRTDPPLIPCRGCEWLQLSDIAVGNLIGFNVFISDL